MRRTLLLAALFLAVPAAAKPVAGEAAERFLSAHNAARDDARLPRLTWSEDLSEAADKWAKKLALDGYLHHSEWEDRAGSGENIWMGTAGYFSPEQMMADFIGEKRDFRPGTFPDVSATGKWEDVAHYTQIVWPRTTAVGCAMARGHGMDFLVCRYSPAGNYFGRPVG